MDLSDRAKATLVRAKTEQVAADKLAAQLQSARDLNGKDKAAKTNSDDGSHLFDKLIGRAQPQQTGENPAGAIEDPAAYLKAQQAAHTRPDGGIDSWSTSASDVLGAPSSPQEIDQWYQTQGKQALAMAQAFPESFPPGLADAIQNRTLTFTNAKDVPGLNFHNWFTSQGGEGGAGGGAGASFNSSLSIFKDPNVQTQVFQDGTVVSWASPTAQS